MNGTREMEMDGQNQPDEVPPPELKAIQDVISLQQVLFYKQLKKMHRLIAVHQKLSGIDPISGEKVQETQDSQNDQTQPPSSEEDEEEGEEEEEAPVKSRKRRHEDEAGPSRPRSDSASDEKGKTSRTMTASEASAPSSKTDIGEDVKGPTKLVARLAKLLGSEGIATVNGVVEFVTLMKDPAWATASGMPLFCTALKETKKPPLLHKFIELNGLRTLSSFLSEAKKKDLLPLIKLILQVLYHLPVTLAALHSCKVGKQVNLLKKTSDDPEVQEISQKLIEGWKRLVPVPEPEPEPEPKPKPSVVKVPLKKKPEPTVPDVEVEAKRTRSDDLETHPRPANGELTNSEADPGAGKPQAPGSSSPKELVKPSSQSEPKEKPKQAENKLVQMHDGDIFPSSGPSTSRPNKPQKKAERLKPDHVRIREEKKKLRAGVQQLSSDPQAEEASATTPGAVPSVPAIPLPKPAKPPAAVPHRPLSADEIKKQKMLEKVNGPRNPSGSSPRAGTAQPSVPPPAAPPPEVKPAGTSEEKAQTPPVQSNAASEVPVVKPVRRVSWAQGDKLCECIHFTVVSTDDEERPAEVVFSHENFARGLKLECSRERQALESEKHKHEDEQHRLLSMHPTVPWRTPPDIDLPEELLFSQGQESEERLKQQAREATVLEAIYLKASSIPDEPHRMLVPDKEWDDRLTPTIPLEEVSEPVRAETTQPDLPSPTITQPPPMPTNLSEAEARLNSLLQLLGAQFNHGPTVPPSSLPSQVAPVSLPTAPGDVDNIDVGALVNQMISNPSMLADILANSQLSAIILNLIQTHMGQPNGPQAQNPPLPAPNPPLPNVLPPFPMPPASTALDFPLPMNPGGGPLNLPNLGNFSNPLAAFLSGAGPSNQNLPPASSALLGMLSTNQNPPLPRTHMDAPRGVEQAFHGNPHHSAMQQNDVGPGGLGHGMSHLNFLSGMPPPDSHMDDRYGPPDSDPRGPRGFFTKPCIFYNSPNGCRNGDNCTFIHDPNVPPPIGQGRGRPPFRR